MLVALMPAINPRGTVIKQRLFDLHLNQLALFLDHYHQIKPLGPIMKRRHIQRPNLTHLIGRDAKAFGLGFINPKQRQRMHQIKPVLASRHKPDACPRLTPLALVHLIGATKRLCREPLMINHPRLLQLRRIDQTNVHTTLRHRKIGRHKLLRKRITVHHGRHLNRVLHRFQVNPNTSKPRQRPRI